MIVNIHSFIPFVVIDLRRHSSIWDFGAFLFFFMPLDESSGDDRVEKKQGKWVKNALNL